MKPVITISFKKHPPEDNNYIKAIEEFGGIPRILIPTAVTSYDTRLLDGILLTGGGDIHPSYYKEKSHHTILNVDKARDDFEIELCQLAIDRDIPILGICRGIQIMNVTTGGTLYQDIEEQFPIEVSPQGNDATHPIQILRGTLLNKILNREVAQVNSAHHQAIKKLGKGLHVAARTIEGITEAVYKPDNRFFLGVQYHPERMYEFIRHREKLFQAFIEAAQKRSLKWKK